MGRVLAAGVLGVGFRPGPSLYQRIEGGSRGLGGLWSRWCGIEYLGLVEA